MKLFLFIAVVVALAISSRFITIGFPFSSRALPSEKTGQSFLAVATYGEIKRGKGSQFFNELKATMDSLLDRGGLVGYAARKQLLGPKVWTISVWEDEAALRSFLRSTAHQKAAQNETILPDSFRSSFFQVTASDLPIPWRRARTALKKEASSSKRNGYETASVDGSGAPLRKGSEVDSD
ncbi:MAG: antibiotic biosynthesis monooxygenase [Verrucomicrobiota bacterium]